MFVRGVYVGGVFERCRRRSKEFLKQNKTRFILPLIRKGPFIYFTTQIIRLYRAFWYIKPLVYRGVGCKKRIYIYIYIKR